MTKSYLLTRPEHDDTTHYLSNWSKGTIDAAKKAGIKVLDLNREKAIQKEVEGRLKDISPVLVVLNGHGDENKVTGHQNEPLIICGKNETLLKSKIVYAISCQSAKVLGKKSVEAGAISYSGYDDDFVFFYEPHMISKPLNDKTAQMFLEHSKIFIETLIKGNTIEEAQKRAKDKLRSNINKLLVSTEADANMVRYLVWDLKHFVSHGNINATI